MSVNSSLFFSAGQEEREYGDLRISGNKP